MQGRAAGAAERGDSEKVRFYEELENRSNSLISLQVREFESRAAGHFCLVLRTGAQEGGEGDIPPFLLAQCCSECIKLLRRESGFRDSDPSAADRLLDHLEVAGRLFPRNPGYRVELGWEAMLAGSLERAQGALEVRDNFVFSWINFFRKAEISQ